jgi:lipase
MVDSVSPLFVSTFSPSVAASAASSPAARQRTAVCLHGIESHGGRFIGLASRIDRLRVVAPDLRGHGRSPRDGPWTIEQHVSDVTSLLAALPEPPVLLGHSFGGLLAWEVARTAGGLASALVLVDPAISVSVEHARASMAYESSYLGHSWADAREAFEFMAARHPPSGAWAAALDVAVAVEAGADERLHPLIAPDAVPAAWAAMQEPLRTSDFGGPVLLLEAGRENGRFVSPAVVRQMREELGDRLDHRVLDATHTMTSDFPDLLASAVGEFLARLS